MEQQNELSKAIERLHKIARGNEKNTTGGGLMVTDEVCHLEGAAPNTDGVAGLLRATNTQNNDACAIFGGLFGKVIAEAYGAKDGKTAGQKVVSEYINVAILAANQEQLAELQIRNTRIVMKIDARSLNLIADFAENRDWYAIEPRIRSVKVYA